MSDKLAMYRGALLQHGKSPRNCGELDAPSASHSVTNPLCGDAITVSVRVEDGVVVESGFTSRACLICNGAASMMTEALAGRSIEDARALAAAGAKPPYDEGAEPPLAELASAKIDPTRFRCAALPFAALGGALDTIG